MDARVKPGHDGRETCRFTFARRRPPPSESRWRALRAVFHNGAMIAVLCQVSLVYGVAGLTKVQGALLCVPLAVECFRAARKVFAEIDKGA